MDEYGICIFAALMQLLSHIFMVSTTPDYMFWNPFTLNFIMLTCCLTIQSLFVSIELNKKESARPSADKESSGQLETFEIFECGCSAYEELSKEKNEHEQDQQKGEHEGRNLIQIYIFVALIQLFIYLVVACTSTLVACTSTLMANAMFTSDFSFSFVFIVCFLSLQSLNFLLLLKTMESGRQTAEMGLGTMETWHCGTLASEESKKEKTEQEEDQQKKWEYERRNLIHIYIFAALMQHFTYILMTYTSSDLTEHGISTFAIILYFLNLAFCSSYQSLCICMVLDKERVLEELFGQETIGICDSGCSVSELLKKEKAKHRRSSEREALIDL